MKKSTNHRSILFSNVVDKLNEKYLNEESGTMFYPFSFVDNTMTQGIFIFGVHPLWNSEEGYPCRNGEELEGEDFENAIISICEEEYGEIINNLYGAYAMVHNRNFGPENTVEVEVPHNGGDDNIVITHYRKVGQLVNDAPKGARVYHPEHELYASCHEHDNRFKNKLAAIAELNRMIKAKGNE